MRTDIPARSAKREVWLYQRERPGFVWDAAVLAGNPFTFPEVLTILDGVTVGGRKISDARQVENLAEAVNELLFLVRSRSFALDKPTFDRLQWLIARDETVEAGEFRGDDDRNLRALHIAGIEFLTSELDSPFEQAIAYFLFAALQQFYFDGNKRTGRFMMNGHLMMHGIDAISVPAARRQEFNAGMVRFFLTKDATDMFEFLTSCLPDVGD